MSRSVEYLKNLYGNCCITEENSAVQDTVAQNKIDQVGSDMINVNFK